MTSPISIDVAVPRQVIASNRQPPLAHPLDDRRVAVREEAALAGLELRDAAHVGLVECEVEDVQVLFHPLLAHRFGKGRDAPLDEPAKHDLSDRFAVLAADIDES